MRSYGSFSPNAIWSLVAVNVLVFIVTLIRRDTVSFLGLTPALLPHQPWTIITNLFVHGGFTHIMFNMISLYFLGGFLIRLVGDGNFSKVYFLGGIAGNILYIVLGPQNIPGVGASGAIFALGGALVVMAPTLSVFVFPIPVPVPLWAAMVFFLVISFFVRGIAWQAHLGGFLLGLLAGWLFKRRRPARYYF